MTFALRIVQAIDMPSNTPDPDKERRRAITRLDAMQRSVLTDPSPRLRPAYMTMRDFCDFVGLSDSLVYELVAQGSIQTSMIGRRRLVDVESRVAFIRSREARPRDQRITQESNSRLDRA